MVPRKSIPYGLSRGRGVDAQREEIDTSELKLRQETHDVSHFTIRTNKSYDSCTNCDSYIFWARDSCDTRATVLGVYKFPVGDSCIALLKVHVSYLSSGWYES